MDPRTHRLPVRVNWKSPQAAGLVYWLPLLGDHIPNVYTGMVQDEAHGARGVNVHPEFQFPAYVAPWSGIYFGSSNFPSISPWQQDSSGPPSWDIEGEIAIAARIYILAHPTGEVSGGNGTVLVSTGATNPTFIQGWGMWLERISSVNYLRVGRHSSGVVFVGASWAIDSRLDVGVLADIWGGWRNGEWLLFVNGDLVASQSDATGATGLGTGTVPRIGCMYFDGGVGGTSYWRNWFTDFRLYNQWPGDTVPAQFHDPATALDLYYTEPEENWLFIIPSGSSYDMTLTGAITPAGAIIKQDQKTLAAQVTPAGNLARQLSRVLSGSLTPSGVVTFIKVVLRSFSGSVPLAGGFIKQGARTLAGTTTTAGTLGKQAQKIFGGALTPSGVLTSIKAVLRSFAGAVAPSGVLTRNLQLLRNLSGILTPSGTLEKQGRKVLSGALTPSGVLTSIKAILRAFSGTVAPEGELNKQASRTLSGSLAPAAGLSKEITKVLNGSLMPAGASEYIKTLLRSFSGAVFPAAELTKRASKTLAGSLGPAGGLLKMIARVFIGSLTTSGAFTGTKSVLMSLSGAVSPLGSLIKQTGIQLVGSVSPAGGLVKTIRIFFSGIISAIGTAAFEKRTHSERGTVVILDQPLTQVTVSDAACYSISADNE